MTLRTTVRHTAMHMIVMILLAMEMRMKMMTMKMKLKVMMMRTLVDKNLKATQKPKRRIRFSI